jgi:hypothetical protein
LTPKELAEWKNIIERVSNSGKPFFDSVGVKTVAHLGKIGDKYLVVHYYAEGPMKGLLASAYIPNAEQLSIMLKKASGQ